MYTTTARRTTQSRTPIPRSKCRILPSKPVTGDRCTVALDILIAKIGQKSSPTTNQLEQAAPGMMILAMQTQVSRQPIDTLCQQCDLYLRRTGIGLVGTVRGNDLFFLCWLQRHVGGASSDRKTVDVIDACIMGKTPVAMALDRQDYSTLATSFTKHLAIRARRDCPQ